MFSPLRCNRITRASVRRLIVLSVMLVSLAIGVMTAPLAGGATTFVFAVGDAVVVDTDGLNLRGAPSTSAAVIGVLHGGDGMTVLGGPVSVDGYTWYEVETATGADGWVAGEYLCLGSGEDVKPFIVGETVAVNTDSLNLRAEPSLSASVLHVFSQGNVMKVTGGPTMAGGYIWYEVSAWAAGPASGWVAGMYLIQVTSSPDDDDPSGFPPLSAVRVDTDLLNVRTGPGFAYAVIRQLPQGTTFLIGSGPVAADGYSWYTMEVADQPISGWVAGEFLSLTSGGDPGSPWVPSFAIGDSAIVDTPRLNGRAGPGLGYAVEQILTGGAEVEVLDGPTGSDGYHWYQVETGASAVVWVIGEGLIA